jgi:O-antigen ligase
VQWYERNVASTLTNRNVFAAYLMFITMMALVLLTLRRRRAQIGLALSVVLVVLVILKGMAATAATGLVIGTYLLLPPMWKRMSVPRVAVWLVLVVSLAVVMAFHRPVSRVLASGPVEILVDAYEQGQQRSVDDRIASLQRAIAIWSEHPVIGAGLGVGRFFNYNPNGTGWAESVYTMQLAETGLVGLLLILALEVIAVVRAVRLYTSARSAFGRAFGRGMVACWAGVLFFGLFETAIVISPQVNMLFWGLLALVEGAIGAETARARQERAEPAYRRLAAGAR